MQQNKENNSLSLLTDLSEIWQELLGDNACEVHPQVAPDEVKIPVLESDPWSALLKAKSVKLIDLQHLHLHMSDQDIEQLLQVMQEQIIHD